MKEPTKADPHTEYIVPLESPQNGASAIPKVEVRTRTIVTDFEELEDGSLIDLVEDPADLHQTMLAVWKHGNVECSAPLKTRQSGPPNLVQL